MQIRETVHAAVAVLLRADGQVLLAQRPAGKAWAGWWEFPGGKIEAGETALAALQRELQEELGTEAVDAYPWLTRSFDYPEKMVQLHFFMVRRWRDEPHGREGQQLSWQNPSALTVAPMLPANMPILAALGLPPIYAISNLAALGETAFFAALDNALRSGLRLIQVREKQLQPAALKAFARRVIAAARPYGARVLINSDLALVDELQADGVHLSAAQLMALDEKPRNRLCAASCHNAQELAHAQALALDFAVLSPVLPTASHAEASPLGWDDFARLVNGCPIPVYALGGMQAQHLHAAWQRGAHGIAMQRAAWR